MRNALAIIASIISLASALPYIIDTARGKTHPNLVTWITWTLVNAINTAAALSAHALPTAALAGTSTLGTLVIVLLGLKRGVRKYTPFDIVCQAAALAGIVVWQLTSNPNLAVLIVIGVELLAAAPTWHHAWTAPFAETWEGFGMAVVAAACTLLSLTHYSFISLAFPVTFGANSALIVAIILARRRKLGSAPPA